LLFPMFFISGIESSDSFESGLSLHAGSVLGELYLSFNCPNFAFAGLAGLFNISFLGPSRFAAKISFNCGVRMKTLKLRKPNPMQ